MNHQFYYRVRKFCLLFSLLLFQGSVFSQSHTLAHSFHTRTDLPLQNPEVSTQSLKESLKQIEAKFGVHFTYNEKNLEGLAGQLIDGSISDVNAWLTKLLNPHGLAFKRYKKPNNTYFIYVKKEKAGRGDIPSNSGNALGKESSEVQVNPSIQEELGQPKLDSRDAVAFAVSGKVTSDAGEGIPGVNVLLKGTTTGTSTDSKGEYTLTVPDGNGTLVFSFIGYVPEEISIGNQTTVNVVLLPDVKALSEVVVVGYGTQKKSDVTGAISTIKASDIQTQGNNTIQKSLQGRMAGVQVESAGGSPGSGVRMLIRGTGTLGNTDPLYIVDGVQVDNINYLNPTDVASMDVLKDASAAAIYGSRAANGVVLITTKSGKKGDLKVDFNANLGSQRIIKQYEVLNASEWATVSNAAHDNAGLARLPLASNTALGAGTNWQKEIYQTAPLRSYNLAASGGGDNYTFSVSGAYFNQEGIVKKTDYDRFNLRIKSDFTKGRVKVGESIILSRESQSPLMQGFVGNNNSPVETALKMIPAFNVYDPTAVGGYAGATGAVTDVPNPVAQLNLLNIKKHTNTAVINLFAEISLVKGLKYKYNFGYTNTAIDSNGYQQPFTLGTFYNLPASKLGESTNKINYILQEHTLNYAATFGKHSIDALAGFTYQNTQYHSLYGFNQGTPGNLQVLDAATGAATVGSNSIESALVSYLGRLVYTYENRYVITGTVRQDASSRFAPGNQYGVFPSVALGWNVSNESFFTPLTNVVSNFKVRGSYGVLGNQNLPDYLYTPTISYNTNYVIGTGQSTWVGATQLSLPSSNIKWESSKTYDVGMDIGLFSDRLSLTADYFVKKSSDVLLQVPTPLSSGTSDNSPYVNAGQITNKGLELALSYRNTSHEITYQLSGTFAAINNKVDYLATGSQQIFAGEPIFRGASSTVTQAGLPVGSFYLIKADGIFQSQDEINTYTKDGELIQPNAKPGDIKFEDANNDGLIDQSDRQLMGSPTPKFTYGFGGNAAWKGFDLAVFFQGTYGNKIYNGFRQDLESMNLEQNYAKSTLDAWTPQNTATDMPRAVINDPNFNGQTSSRFLEDGSYLRLRTLQVGYSVPQALLAKAKISNCRFYISFDNLFTVTKYKGYNPDLGRSGSVLNRGVDRATAAYPLSRTSMVGLQLSF